MTNPMEKLHLILWIFKNQIQGYLDFEGLRLLKSPVK